VFDVPETARGPDAFMTLRSPAAGSTAARRWSRARRSMRWRPVAVASSRAVESLRGPLASGIEVSGSW